MHIVEKDKVLINNETKENTNVLTSLNLSCLTDSLRALHELLPKLKEVGLGNEATMVELMLKQALDQRLVHYSCVSLLKAKIRTRKEQNCRRHDDKCK